MTHESQIIPMHESFDSGEIKQYIMQIFALKKKVLTRQTLRMKVNAGYSF